MQRAEIAKLRPLLNWKMKSNDDSVALVRAGRVKEAVAAFSDEQELQPLVAFATSSPPCWPRSSGS